jgi:hypothetical protein
MAGFRGNRNAAPNDDRDRTREKDARENEMSANPQPLLPRKKLLSIDTWAVLIALAAALLIRAGILTRVPW